MEQPPPLNLIQLGNEWIVTNGELADDGNLRFPDDDTAEEVFITIDTAPLAQPLTNPSVPRSQY